MSTQQVYRLHSYGGPDSIQMDTVPVPVPGPSQVLISISTVGMNPFDWKIREGYVRDVMPLQLPAILGVDFCGVVVGFGEGASKFRLGDRVMTMSTSLGAFAEYITVDESILARVPAELSDVSAATIPIPGLTAWQGLHAAGELRSGMRILIHGASGLVGAFAVQIAKSYGAHVMGTASAKNRDYVMGLGADEFCDYQTERFEERFDNVDLVLDCILVGGVMNTTDRSWGVLKANGAIVSVADPMITSKIPPGFRGFFPTIEPSATQMEMIAAQMTCGKMVTQVAQVYPRADLVEAMERNKLGGTTGRLIVDFKRV